MGYRRGRVASRRRENCDRGDTGHLGSGPIAPVVVVIVPREASGTVLVKKDHRLMGRDFKALLTGLAGHIIIHSDEVIS